MSITVIVTALKDSDNSPISGAVVKFVYPDGTSTFGSNTDNNGVSSTVMGVLPGTCEYEIRVSLTGYTMASVNVSGQVDSSTKVWLLADNTIRVTFKVLDVETGLAIKTAIVVVEYLNDEGAARATSGYTSDSGEVTLELPKSQSNMKITVTHPVYQTLKVAGSSTDTTFKPTVFKLKKKTMTTYFGGTPPP